MLQARCYVPAHRIRNAPIVLLDGCYAYYSISRTILPKHTDRVPIEESAYQFWSKTDKNGRTYGATGVDLQTIFSTDTESWGALVFCTPLVKPLLEGKTMSYC